MNYQEIETPEALLHLLQNTRHITHIAFQNLDFTPYQKILCGIKFSDCLFLGCQLPEGFENQVIDCFIFPKLNMPYNCYPAHLYSPKDLYAGYEPGKPETFQNTYDQRVYKHYLKTGKHPSDIKETLARRLHDHAITDALDDFVANYDEKQIVAIMGGHGLLRNTNAYREIVLLSKKLTEAGYLMLSGGGPGAMEATHLGAWLAGQNHERVEKSLMILSKVPHYKDPLWLDTAFEIRQKFPQNSYKSLAIPTWLYGHEPSTAFATHIAKYFANSVREDGLLTLAKGGIVFAPGSAGTMQEIFQEATQNHYLSFGYASPMIFMNKTYWSEQLPVYPFLKELLEKGMYKNLLLSIYDNINGIVEEIKAFTHQNIPVS